MDMTVRSAELAPPVLNVDLLKRVLAKIENDPSHWDQDSWVRVLPGLKADEVSTPVVDPCQTTCCMAGTALLLSGQYRIELDEHLRACFVSKEDDQVHSPRTVAQQLLGLTDEQAHYLFITLTTRSPKRFVRTVLDYLHIPSEMG